MSMRACGNGKFNAFIAAPAKTDGLRRPMNMRGQEMTGLDLKKLIVDAFCEWAVLET